MGYTVTVTKKAHGYDCGCGSDVGSDYKTTEGVRRFSSGAMTLVAVEIVRFVV